MLIKLSAPRSRSSHLSRKRSCLKHASFLSNLISDYESLVYIDGECFNQTHIHLQVNHCMNPELNLSACAEPEELTSSWTSRTSTTGCKHLTLIHSCWALISHIYRIPGEASFTTVWMVNKHRMISTNVSAHSQNLFFTVQNKGVNSTSKTDECVFIDYCHVNHLNELYQVFKHTFIYLQLIRWDEERHGGDEVKTPARNSLTFSWKATCEDFWTALLTVKQTKDWARDCNEPN